MPARDAPRPPASGFDGKSESGSAELEQRYCVQIRRAARQQPPAQSLEDVVKSRSLYYERFCAVEKPFKTQCVQYKPLLPAEHGRRR